MLRHDLGPGHVEVVEVFLGEHLQASLQVENMSKQDIISSVRFTNVSLLTRRSPGPRRGGRRPGMRPGWPTPGSRAGSA